MSRSGSRRLSPEEKALVEEHRLKMQQIHFKNELEEGFSRGRSITVGTALGGVTEVSIRRVGGNHVWVLLQPVEVVELINQLAANIGCHLHLQPRQDFASWRSWNYSTEELTHARGVQQSLAQGFPPHAKAIMPGGYTTELPPPEEQAGMPTPMLEEKHEETLAAKTPKRRRASKRATASS